MSEAQLTDSHYILFGRIMYGYASAESRFKILLSAMLDMDIGTFLIVSEPYNSSQLKNVLKSITKLSEFESDDEFDKIIALVGRFQTFSKMRNKIAHSRWVDGDRPNSIKPISMNIREGKAVPSGYVAGEKDYTIEDLWAITKELFDLSNDANTFIKDYGYSAIIERKISDKSKRIDGNDG